MLGSRGASEGSGQRSHTAQRHAQSAKRSRQRAAGSRTGSSKQLAGTRLRRRRAAAARESQDSASRHSHFLEIVPIYLNVAENLAEQAGSAGEQMPAGSWRMAAANSDRVNGREGDLVSGQLVKSFGAHLDARTASDFPWTSGAGESRCAPGRG